MNARLTHEEFGLLKQLAAEREKGRTVSVHSHVRGIDRLVRDGCVLE